MEALRRSTVALLLALLALPTCAVADQIPVRHLEGVTLGFLMLRDLHGETLAYGYLKEAVKPGDPVVLADLQFHFRDGSYYREITKFTQNGTFRLLSDQVVQQGPSFKQQLESWLDATTGKITLRKLGEDKDKGKEETKHIDVPADAANGLLFTLAKNIEPSAAQTTVSMVAISTSPRVVKLQFVPAPEKSVTVGTMSFKAQHYVVHVKIPGAAGVVAPLVGKSPPDIHLWIIKSEAPTFAEFEGPLSADGPVWRIELAAPEPDKPNSSSH